MMINKSKRKAKSKSFSKKFKQNGFGNAPTPEELNSLREAESMFHSNLFKMQVEELFKEVRFVTTSDVQFCLDSLKSMLENISESSFMPIEDYVKNEELVVPLVIPNCSDRKASFKFVAPSKIQEVGSYTNDTLCSHECIIDVAVEMPKECWHGSDHLNYIYHQKRAVYLARIAKHLSGEDSIEDLQFVWKDGLHLKPVLLVTMKKAKDVKFCLMPYPQLEGLCVKKFHPNRNNVRTSWFLGSDTDDLCPTPAYSSSVLCDLLLPQLNKLLKECTSEQNVKDAIVLLKVWASQRGLSNGTGRLNGFMLSMLVVYLIKSKKLSPLMSSYQIFRSCLLALKNGTLTENGITLAENSVNAECFETYKNKCPSVFVDASGYLNMCFSTFKETLIRVKHEANIGLAILDEESMHSFSHLFMRKITFERKYEYLLHLQGVKRFQKYLEKLEASNDILENGGDMIDSVLPKISDILHKGLNKRIKMLDIERIPHKPWPINEKPPNPNTDRVTIGFLLNPDVPATNLEKGPLADDPEAKDFRDFWGSRSDLRRFLDGTIREAVFWPANTYADKRKVFCDIVKYILERHINAKPEFLKINGTELDCVLQLTEGTVSSDFPEYGSGEESHQKAIESYDGICKQLRALEGLPLLINSIQGTSATFRFSEVFPPLSVSHDFNMGHCIAYKQVMKIADDSRGVPPYVPALKAIITLEGSGKWPDDVEALKRLKAAFHLKIADLMKCQCSLIAVPFLTHTDVFKDGYVFRFEVACHKEIYLLKREIEANGVIKIKETKESKDLEVRTEVMPKLNSILHGLHQQHNSFGTTCRLAKRWISAQLKSGFIHDVTIELIVAHAYLYPEPFTIPCSPQIGFIRFLTLLLDHDWLNFPLIVNFNGELKSQEIEEINTAFSSQRSTFPPMVISTPLDKRGNMFTKNMPSSVFLKQMMLLSKSSLNTLDDLLQNRSLTDTKIIFRPPLTSFDVLIYLKRSEIPRLAQNVDSQETDILPNYKPYTSTQSELFPVVEYDPVQLYLEELRTYFGDLAHFLCDTYGGDVIAVMWKKSQFEAKEFKTSHVHYRQLLEGQNQISPNAELLLEEFEILGRGLVHNIIKQTKNWQIP